ncbi:MAG: phosphatidylserine decarboxylase [Planctomycetota bacterium]
MVRYAHYRPSAFLDARDPRAATQNEAHSIGLEVGSVKILVRQVAGLIARRIVCPVPLGTTLQKGERYGMIKFGSRTEIHIPTSAGVDVLVAVGQRVAGGATAIARVAALRADHGAGANLTTASRA